MNQTNIQFGGSIPEKYDAHLGPLLFDFAAADRGGRVAAAVPEGARVLEVACGTGISTEHLRHALPTSVEIIATDLNPAMLDYAKEKRGTLPKVSVQPADALALPFADHDFDAVVCQFGIMFFPDKAKGIAEMVRVLRPEGPLVFNVWDSLEHNQVIAIGLEVIAAYFETDPPKFLEVPSSYFEIDPIEKLMRTAVLGEIAVHVVKATIERPDATDVARGCVEGNPGIHEIKEWAMAQPEIIVAPVAEAVEAAFGPAPLKIPLQEIVFSTVKPG